MNTKLYNYKVRHRILNRDNFTCQYCGAKLKWGELHIDHIIPRSKGGKNEDSNYLAACQRCNSSKCDRSLEEFLEMAIRHKSEFSSKLRYCSGVVRGLNKILEKRNERKS